MYANRVNKIPCQYFQLPIAATQDEATNILCISELTETKKRYFTTKIYLKPYFYFLLFFFFASLMEFTLLHGFLHEDSRQHAKVISAPVTASVGQLISSLWYPLET